jgi:DnaJ-domain-containing protein 1
LAFQLFRRNQVGDHERPDEAGSIDLTDANQVIVDLGAHEPAPPPFTNRGYAPFPDPGFEAPGSRFVGDRSDEAERISAWADRMRQKRERDRAAILGDTEPKAGAAGYWSSEHLECGDDPTLDPGVVADPSRRGRLLGELGLTADADADDIASAYRRLAKKHHPDRWAEADEATRRLNAEEMMRVNAVYRALRISGDVGPRGRASTPPAPPAPGPR